MKYYEEITEELKKIPEGVKSKNSCISLFESCKAYAHFCHINEAIADSKKVLQNYLNEEDCISKYNLKGEEKEGYSKERKRKQSLDIPSKLYIEFFWNAYHKHYDGKTEKDFFNEVVYDIDSGEKIDRVWKEIFSKDEEAPLSLKRLVKLSIDELSMEYGNTRTLESLHLQNLHAAMEALKKGLEISEPCISDSVEDIIVPGELQLILDYLKAKNYSSCLFTTAPILRALTIGKINSFTPQKDNTSVFFNKMFEYNYTQLNTYINALKDLYDEYTEIADDLKNL